MLRSIVPALRSIRQVGFNYVNASRIISNRSVRSTHTLTKQLLPVNYVNQTLINNKEILRISENIGPIQTRTVTKFSLKKGKRKTVKAVIRRFFRLHWGGWIRTKCGRHKKMWKKSASRRRRLREHVTCNATQSNLLDKMVTKFWKKPKYYIDDPYAPYHTREHFTITRKKPLIRD